MSYVEPGDMVLQCLTGTSHDCDKIVPKRLKHTNGVREQQPLPDLVMAHICKVPLLPDKLVCK